MIFASSIGEIAHPFFFTFAWFLALYYRLIPNYAIAIALLTLTVMIVVFPITRRATRGMMKMQLLQPEMRVIQAKYKAKQGMSVEERRESREHLNEEMMALYRENGVSPTGGCLPMFLQLPAFWILYGTIKGLIYSNKAGQPEPRYISHASSLYRAIKHAPVHDGHAVLKAFGIDIADSVRSAGLSWPAKIPFIILILAAMGLQYTQMRQLQGRNAGAAQGNPQMEQMQKMQKYFPLILGIIYISIPAGVNVYFIVSSLFRIGQQEFMHRRDPQIKEAGARLRARVPTSGGKAPPPAKKDVVDTTARKSPPAAGSSTAPRAKPAGSKPNSTRPNGARSNGARSNGAKAGTNGNAASQQEELPKAQPRSRDKRRRRPR